MGSDRAVPRVVGLRLMGYSFPKVHDGPFRETDGGCALKALF